MSIFPKLGKIILISAFAASVSACGAKKTDLADDAAAAMKKAAAYMLDSVSVNGGFVWNVLPDNSRRWGEMEAGPGMIWMQAPSTPGVGEVLLRAYHATGDEFFYDAAMKVAGAVMDAQLACGGWNYCFDYAGEESLREWYRTVGYSGWRLEEFQHYYGNATFDDSATTDAAKFLLHLYSEKHDATVKSALDKAIAFVLESQYPAGGWPQRYPIMTDRPDDYTPYITINDDVLEECIDFLMQCRQSLAMEELTGPIQRAMKLVAKLQYKAPYAGWSDQYTPDDLMPAGARSYEPRAIEPRTTAKICRSLMQYYRITGDRSYIEGIPEAISFIESQALPESEIERFGRPRRDPDAILTPTFVDPDSGKPLYVHREGSNVFNGRYFVNQDISNTIAHYGSAAWINTRELRVEYDALPDEYDGGRDAFAEAAPGMSAAEMARKTISALDGRGRWISRLRNTSNPYKAGASAQPSHVDTYISTMAGDEFDTSPYPCTEDTDCISTAEFIRNMGILCAYLESLEAMKPHVWTVEEHPGVLETFGKPEVTDVNGGKAVEFDGDDGIFLSSVPVRGLDAFTVEAIIKPGSGGPFEQRFMHMGTYDRERVMMEVRVNPDGTWYPDCFIKLNFRDNKALIDDGKTFPADKWYNLTFTVGPDGIASYVDGELQCSDILSYRPVINSGLTSLGVRQNGKGWFTGAIYKIRVSPGVLEPEEFLKDQDSLNER